MASMANWAGARRRRARGDGGGGRRRHQRPCQQHRGIAKARDASRINNSREFTMLFGDPQANISSARENRGIRRRCQKRRERVAIGRCEELPSVLIDAKRLLSLDATADSEA